MEVNINVPPDDVLIIDELILADFQITIQASGVGNSATPWKAITWTVADPRSAGSIRPWRGEADSFKRALRDLCATVAEAGVWDE